ncbi:hypothetical protein, partial [Campylobacter vulpis]
MQILEEYQNKLLEIYKTEDFAEHSFRTPFENLLNALKPKEIKIIHEPKSEKGQGSIRPDFKVYKLVDKEKELSYNHLIGFIECKNLDVDLDKEFKIIHEPKSEKGQGSIRPDFKVYKLVDKEK